MMGKLLALALVPGLLLFGCAASKEAPKEQAQAQAQAQECLSAAALREGMAQSGAELKADLEGEIFDAFIEWLTPHLNNPLPAGFNRAMIFEKEGKAVIVLLKQDCVAGHMVGPWEPIKAFLLSRPHV